MHPSGEMMLQAFDWPRLLVLSSKSPPPPLNREQYRQFRVTVAIAGIALCE